jgi:type VI secretion system secreted protein VgrG
MESSPSQRDSQIAASIPSLGEDVLLLRHMTGTEQVGRLFEYELELLSTDHGIKLRDVLGHRLTVSLKMRDEDTRFFNGHVARFTYSGVYGEYARYRAIVRPWFWFLTLTNDCRIFQDMTVPEIVEDTFQRRGFSDFRMNLTAEYRPREYATQYIETDFDFVSRLMENEGIFYFFEHEDGKHTAVICDGDGISDYRPPMSGYEEVPFLAAEGTDHVTEHISEWVVSEQVAPGGVHLKDFRMRKRPRVTRGCGWRRSKPSTKWRKA